MLAAGGGYIRGSTSIEGELSMNSLARFRNHPPLPQVQIWATEHLIAAEVGDLRWMLVALITALTAGVSSGSNRKTVRLAFFNPIVANAFTASQYKGIQLSAKKAGASVTQFDAEIWQGHYACFGLRIDRNDRTSSPYAGGVG
jgi:uncharacterized membrane protein